MIVGALDPFFDYPGRYLGQSGGPDWRRGRENVAPRLNTTTFAFDFGDQVQILKTFLRDRDAAYSTYPNDQDYAEAFAEGRAWWPDGWIVSFKRHLCRPVGLDMLRPPLAPGPEVRIVAFHGNPRPGDLIGRRGLWWNPPHAVKCPVGWLEAYFRAYGG